MMTKYLSYRKGIAVIFVIFIIFEAIVLSLIHLDSLLIGYLVMVWFFLVACFAIFDYIRFKVHYRDTVNLKNSLDGSLDFGTISADLFEAKYLELLKELRGELKSLEKTEYHKYLEMIDYYTLWVHQIKTPISALKLLLQTQGNNQEMVLELLKIEQYVNMVLQFLRLEDINNDLTFEYVPLENMVSEVLKKQVTFFAKGKINLEYHLDEIKVLTDEKWSSFVIEQVLSNAIKYTKQGTISIYNDQDKLYVKDTGVGIKAEDLPRIFDRGFTGFLGRQDKKASGIGLFLAKSIVDKLGHEITVESKPGNGTTVCIDFYKKNIFID